MVFKKGHTGWNKGLKYKLSVTSPMKGKTYEEIYGLEKAKEKKDNQRKKIIGKKSFIKNKTYDEQYGLEKAKTIKERLRLGHLGVKHTKEQNIKLKNKTQEFWDNPKNKEKRLNAIFKGFKKRPTAPEQSLIKIIKENNLPFNYVGDGGIWLRGKHHSFNPDFLSKNPKHIIEVFGNYWHNREDMKKRDEERLQTYSKYGYKTLIIWEHELKKNQQEILNKINKFMGEDIQW